MNSRQEREFQVNEYAPVPVPRKRSWLRRHWLSGAFVCTLLGVATYTGMTFYETEAHLQQVRFAKEELRTQLSDANRRNQELQQEINRVNSDEYMEQMAKKLGFARPNETIFQKGSGKGN